MIAVRPVQGTVAARDIGIIFAMKHPGKIPDRKYMEKHLTGFHTYSKAHQTNLLKAAAMGAKGSWLP